MRRVDLQGYIYEERSGMLPSLQSAFAACGGWVIERKSLSDDTVEFRVEIQLAAVIELYGQLVLAGVELTRSAHAALTDLCTCHLHLARTKLPPEITPTHLVAMRLELSFLEDVTLHSLLMTGSELA